MHIVTYIYVHMHEHRHVYRHMHPHLRVPVHIHVGTMHGQHLYILCIHEYTHNCILACMCTCIHAYIHTYIHTHIQYIHAYIHTTCHLCIHAHASFVTGTKIYYTFRPIPATAWPRLLAGRALCPVPHAPPLPLQPAGMESKTRAKQSQTGPRSRQCRAKALRKNHL